MQRCYSDSSSRATLCSAALVGPRPNSSRLGCTYRVDPAEILVFRHLPLSLLERPDLLLLGGPCLSGSERREQSQNETESRR